MERVITYIDGFNLYFGLKTKGWKRYYWLDLQELAMNLLKDNQRLVTTKYFTSRISGPPEKTKRQGTFLEALETLDSFRIFYGHYLTNMVECKKCGDVFAKPNEKMTDVNIAVEVLTDAFQDAFDTALLISADSDLIAPIKKMRRLFTGKKIVIAFPPARSSIALKNIASASFVIGRKKLAKSVFSEQIVKSDGFILQRPERWRYPKFNPSSVPSGVKWQRRKRIQKLKTIAMMINGKISLDIELEQKAINLEKVLRPVGYPGKDLYSRHLEKNFKAIYISC